MAASDPTVCSPRGSYIAREGDVPNIVLILRWVLAEPRGAFRVDVPRGCHSLALPRQGANAPRAVPCECWCRARCLFLGTDNKTTLGIVRRICGAAPRLRRALVSGDRESDDRSTERSFLRSLHIWVCRDSTARSLRAAPRGGLGLVHRFSIDCHASRSRSQLVCRRTKSAII